jgi:hypothetical protein
MRNSAAKDARAKVGDNSHASAMRPFEFRLIFGFVPEDRFARIT